MEAKDIPDSDLIRQMGLAGNPLCWEMARRYELSMRLSEWAKASNLLDGNGEPRKILGEVSVTADGAIVGHPFSSVFYVDRHGNVKQSTFYSRGFGKDCYSTREAAERATGEAREASDGH